jgi:SAM-dependent methyltransferase
MTLAKTVPPAGFEPERSSLPANPGGSISWDKFVSILRCPACGESVLFQQIDQGLPHASEYGILSCGCSRYPVLDGIPILTKKRIGVFENTQGQVQYEGPTPDEITCLIVARRGLDALLRCIAFPLIFGFRPRRLWQSRLALQLLAQVRRAQLRSWCLGNRESLTAEDWLDVFFRQHSPIDGDVFTYFFYRFAQPRHLATLVVTSRLAPLEKPLLDLACGFGHLGYNLSESPSAHPVVGIDRNFFGLWTAQYWIAPKNRFVCADADQPLPFVDGAFGATLCSDAFHYFQRKDLALAEIERCGANGPIILARVGNKLVEPNEGFELTPGEYLRLCADPRWRVFSEEDLMRKYLDREPVDLEGPTAASNVDKAKWLFLIHPGKSGKIADATGTNEWPHAVGRLAINPIYTMTRLNDGNWRLQFKFPSDHYAFENVHMVSYHQQRVTLTDTTMRDIRANIRTPEVDRLISQMVVIGIPDRYLRSSGAESK